MKRMSKIEKIIAIPEEEEFYKENESSMNTLYYTLNTVFLSVSRYSIKILVSKLANMFWTTV